MPKFNYKARRMNGESAQGVVEAKTAAEAKQKVSEQGLIPISVTSAKSELEFGTLFGGSVKPGTLVLFTKQFATLFKAGMGMENILTTLSKQAGAPALKAALDAIREDIQQGSSLSKAFGKHPKIFDGLYTSMLSSGEEAGILDEVLKQLADVLEKDLAMRKGIKSAMLYPKIVVSVLFMACVVMMTFVVPKFQGIFDSLGAELPLPTRIMIGASDFFRGYWWTFFLVIPALWFAYRRYYATPKGKLRIDGLTFRMPVFGPLALKVANARFANILACLYRSGLSVTKALEITGETLGNEAYLRDVKALQSSVEKGNGISESMKTLNYFSPVVIEATAIGERTGALDGMLTSIGEYYDMEINHSIKTLTTALEPMLLGFVFGMVLIFALAIFLPIWRMSDAMLKKG